MLSSGQKSASGQPLPMFIMRGLPEASSSVTSVCFLTRQDKDYLLCGTDCGQILLWSLDSYRCDSMVRNSNRTRVQHLIAFGDQFLCQYKNGWIDVFDDKLSVLKSYPISDATYCKCFLYSGTDFNETSSTNPVINPKILGLVSKNNSIELIDFKTDDILLTVGRTDRTYGWPFTLHMTPQSIEDNEDEVILVIIGYENGFICVFRADINLKESQFLSELKCFETVITAMDFNALKMTGICCSVEEVVIVWTLIVNENKSSISLCLNKYLKMTNGGLLCCAIRSDGRIFVCGGSDNRIRLFALKSLKPLAVMDTHNDAVECLTFSKRLVSKQKQIYLAVGSRDKTISVWNLYNNLQN